MSNSEVKTRIEKDSIGELEVPESAYYGIQTLRTSNNYKVSDHTYSEYPEIVQAIAEIKKACALTNSEINALDPDKAKAIALACDEVIEGKFCKEFPVNVWRSQGTGINMNVNEVLANRANEIISGHKGYDTVHPNTHVNMCQSSNDVFPSAESIVCYRKTLKLIVVVKDLEGVLSHKAEEFKDTVRLGRTGLQDAVPLTWGQVFGCWHAMVYRVRKLLENYAPHFTELILGATVLGTGLGILPGYTERVYQNLSDILGFKVKMAYFEEEVVPDSALFDGSRNTDSIMILMSYVKAIACSVSRIANDLLLFGSGPLSGLNELQLPVCKLPEDPNCASQTWLPEYVVQTKQIIVSLEHMAELGSSEGQQDHGSFNSCAIIEVLKGIDTLVDAVKIFSTDCVSKVTVNEHLCRENAEHSVSLSTLVSTLFGYPLGVRIAKEAIRTGLTCKEVALKENLLPAEVVNELFDVKNLADRRTIVALFEKYKNLRSIA